MQTVITSHAEPENLFFCLNVLGSRCPIWRNTFSSLPFILSIDYYSITTESSGFCMWETIVVASFSSHISLCFYPSYYISKFFQWLNNVTLSTYDRCSSSLLPKADAWADRSEIQARQSEVICFCQYIRSQLENGIFRDTACD